jgi:hypothetical protein
VHSSASCSSAIVSARSFTALAVSCGPCQ